jgi:hypothetical protein
MVDPLIAKAAQIKIASQEEKAVARIFGKDGVREILEWGQSQGDPQLDRIGAIRRLVELGLTCQDQTEGAGIR